MRHIVPDSTLYSPGCAYNSCSLKVTWEINEWMYKESLDIFHRVMAWSTLARCVSETMEGPLLSTTVAKCLEGHHLGSHFHLKLLKAHQNLTLALLAAPSPFLLLLQPICMHASLVCDFAGCRITDDWQPFPENIGSACSLAVHGCFTVTGLSAEASPGTAHVQNVCLRYCQTWQPGGGY